MANGLHRHEHKYLLSGSEATQIMSTLSGLMPYDVHGGAAGYRVDSLYYDSPSLRCFWQRVDGVTARRALRIRLYPSSAVATAQKSVVEIKEHREPMTQKRRLALPLPLAEALCAGELSATLRGQLDPLEQHVASEVSFLVRTSRLRPSAITSYHRIALVGTDLHPNLRVTFDTDLRGRLHALELGRHAPNHRVIGRDWCIMEVKSNGAIPEWVHTLLARRGCQRQGISKYCAVTSQLSGGALPPWLFAKSPPIAAKSGNGALPTDNSAPRGGELESSNGFEQAHE